MAALESGTTTTKSSLWTIAGTAFVTLKQFAATGGGGDLAPADGGVGDLRPGHRLGPLRT